MGTHQDKVKLSLLLRLFIPWEQFVTHSTHY